jgi:hypothetical protein
MTLKRLAVSLLLLAYMCAAILLLFGPVYDRLGLLLPAPIASVVIGFGSAVIAGSVEMLRRKSGMPPDGLSKVFSRGWVQGFVAIGIFVTLLDSVGKLALGHRLPSYLAALALLGASVILVAFINRKSRASSKRDS